MSADGRQRTHSGLLETKTFFSPVHPRCPLSAPEQPFIIIGCRRRRGCWGGPCAWRLLDTCRVFIVIIVFFHVVALVIVVVVYLVLVILVVLLYSVLISVFVRIVVLIVIQSQSLCRSSSRSSSVEETEASVAKRKCPSDVSLCRHADFAQ